MLHLPNRFLPWISCSVPFLSPVPSSFHLFSVSTLISPFNTPFTTLSPPLCLFGWSAFSDPGCFSSGVLILTRPYLSRKDSPSFWDGSHFRISPKALPNTNIGQCILRILKWPDGTTTSDSVKVSRDNWWTCSSGPRAVFCVRSHCGPRCLQNAHSALPYCLALQEYKEPLQQPIQASCLQSGSRSWRGLMKWKPKRPWFSFGPEHQHAFTLHIETVLDIPHWNVASLLQVSWSEGSFR